MKIEEQLFTRLKLELKDTHEVVQNVRIGDCEYDIIATSQALFEKDYIFEVKYIKGNINNTWIKKVYEKISNQTNNYSEKTNRRPYRVLIIITENDNYNLVNNKMQQMSKENNFKIIVGRKSRIKYLKLVKP